MSALQAYQRGMYTHNRTRTRSRGTTMVEGKTRLWSCNSIAILIAKVGARDHRGVILVTRMDNGSCSTCLCSNRGRSKTTATLAIQEVAALASAGMAPGWVEAEQPSRLLGQRKRSSRDMTDSANWPALSTRVSRERLVRLVEFILTQNSKPSSPDAPST